MGSVSLETEGDVVVYRRRDVRTLEEHVDKWAARRMLAGVPARRCVLPFLTGAPKAEVFCRLPLPCVNEDINIDSTITDFVAFIYKPYPYMYISRNVLTKKKHTVVHVDAWCTNCRADSACEEGCECRALLMSCSNNCHCSDLCTNRPFLKDKKMTIVKFPKFSRPRVCGSKRWTKQGGPGVIALEPLEKGDFVIEYVGEGCGIRKCSEKNFYMCEINKDFTIDVTFKGNQACFLNHSCEPNCKLEKWKVDGETRVGVFASRSVKVGDPLTYDFRTLRRHKDKSPPSFHPLDLICEAIGRDTQDVGARAQHVASAGEEQNNMNSPQSSENNMNSLQKMVDFGGQGLDYELEQDPRDESLNVSANDADQQAQRSDEHVTKRPLTTSNGGILKKHKATAEMPCIQETGPVHPESRSAQANVNKQEATQGKDYSISRCLDVLEAMDDVPDEMKILASDVFRDVMNREMFLCYAPRLRGPWLKTELERLHGSHRVN